MHIQVNTDDNVEGRDELARWIETEIAGALSRFSDKLTRVEVHLSDENAGKSGSTDKRCVMEARPRGQQPVAVIHTAATVGEACTGALRKLKHLLESKFAQRDDHKGAASIRDSDPQ